MIGQRKHSGQPETGQQGLQSSEYQTREHRAGCTPCDKEFGYAFFEAPIPSI
jgi:hypothetical protein